MIWFPPEAVTASWFESLTYLLVSCVSYQVVVKTKADYDGESKKGKLRSPKIAEFSISIIEGVSERLKVRIMSLPSSACFISHPISNISSHTYTCVCRRADSGLSAAQDIRHSHRNIPPPPSKPCYTLLCPGHLHLLCPVQPCLLVWATQGDRMHNDSLNPALKLSLIQLLPWRWPLNGSIPPAFPQRPPWPHHTIQGEQNKCSCKRKGQFTVPAPHPCVADFLAYFKIQKKLDVSCIQYSPSALKINRCNRLCEVCQASFRTPSVLWNAAGSSFIAESLFHNLVVALLCTCLYCLLCWATAGFVQTDEKNILLFILIHAVNNLSKPLPNIKGNSTKKNSVARHLAFNPRNSQGYSVILSVS